VYLWYAAGHHDPLFADKGTKLLKADCRFSGTVDGVRSAQPAASGEAAAKKAKGPARKTQTLEKKKNKDKKMKEDKHRRIRLAEAATFLPMRSSKKATVTEQLVAGLQNAFGGPSVNATTKCRQELDNLQKHLSVLAVSGKGKKSKDDSQDEDGKKSQDDSEDEDASPVKRRKKSKDDSEDEEVGSVKSRKKSKDDSEDEDEADSQSGSESVTLLSDDGDEEEEVDSDGFEEGE
jgi:hypothetical protein